MCPRACNTYPAAAGGAGGVGCPIVTGADVTTVGGLVGWWVGGLAVMAVVVVATGAGSGRVVMRVWSLARLLMSTAPAA